MAPDPIVFCVQGRGDPRGGMYKILGFRKGAIVSEGTRWHDQWVASSVSRVVAVPNSAVFDVQGLW